MEDWPLVGRADPLAAAARVVLHGESGGVVLLGAPGVGKTRLAHDVAAAAAGRGLPVLRAQGSESAATIPFGALAPLLPRIGDERDPLALLQAVQDDLSGQDGGPPVLWLDDAHHLDAGSATLVQQLVAAGTCRLLGTVRSGVTVPDAVETLWRNGAVDIVELGPLDQPGVAEVLDAVLGAPVAGRTVVQLWRRTRGNPLYLREVVRAALQDGSLSNAGGAWTLRDSDTTSMRLVEIVRARLGGLGASAAAVELLAVADALSPQLLAGLAPGADVEDLEARGLVSVAADGRRARVQLAHPLYGEVVRSHLPVTRRRRWHRELAAAVEARGARRREDVLQTATWLLDSDRRPSAAILTEAARQAGHRFDLPLAERLARAAAEAGGGVAALVVRADATWRQGRYDEALEVLADAAVLARGEQEVADVADSRAYVLDLAGRPGEAWQVLTDAAARVGPERRDLLDSQAAILSILAGRAPQALDTAQRVVAAHGGDRSALPVLVRVRADYAATFALALLGRYDEACATASATAEFLAGAPETHLPPELALLGRVVAHVLAGRPAEAVADAERVESAALALGDRDAEWTAALYRGRVALAHGAVAEALAHLDRASAVAGELGDRAGRRWALGGRTLCLALLGRADEAASAAAALLAEPSPGQGLLEVDLVGRGLGWAEVAAGRRDCGRERLRSAADLAAELGQPGVELVVRHDLLRLGDRSQAAPIRRLAEAMPGPLPRAAAAHAAAVRSGRGDDLAEAAEQLAACGARVEAAEAAAAAAAAYRHEGVPRRATALQRRLADLGALIPGVRTPELVVTPSAQVALTARERDIALLAATRMSAADIAERLFLSRRTVENHLQRIYTKLGITSRAELERALAD